MNAPLVKPVSLLNVPGESKSSSQAPDATGSAQKTPQVVCPCCGTMIRLALVEPLYNGAKSHNRMLFNCSCGIEYWIRDRVGKEPAR